MRRESTSRRRKPTSAKAAIQDLYARCTDDEICEAEPKGRELAARILAIKDPLERVAARKDAYQRAEAGDPAALIGLGILYLGQS